MGGGRKRKFTSGLKATDLREHAYFAGIYYKMPLVRHPNTKSSLPPRCVVMVLRGSWEAYTVVRGGFLRVVWQPASLLRGFEACERGLWGLIVRVCAD
jgi:hypothetical protein